jgi:hypothetical protein
LKREIKMGIIIPKDKIVTAVSAEAWNMCLWGNPKALVICGNCYGQFKTRDYYPINRGQVDENSVANCPHCGMWNELGFIFNY